MSSLSNWLILMILSISSFGLLLEILLWIRERKPYWKIPFPFRPVAVFSGGILLTLLFPLRWWSLAIGFTVSAFVLFPLLDLINTTRHNWKQAREEFGLQDPSAEDQDVLDDFRQWSAGGDVGRKKEVIGFAAYASRERGMDREVIDPTQSQDPICSNCGTVYNREVVINLIKQQSPEIFDFQTWTTKFVCKQCRHEIVISGSQGG